MSDQDEINAERARLNHEPEEGVDFSRHRGEVCELLGASILRNWANPKITRAPEIQHAIECIEEIIFDNPDELMDGFRQAYVGNSKYIDQLMLGYIRTYAEAHLPELVDFFQIETGEKK